MQRRTVLKKPPIILSSYQTFQYLQSPAHAPSRTPQRLPPETTTPATSDNRSHLNSRTFATSHRSSAQLTPPWPTSPRTSPPTPYEIFHLPPTAPYSKRRFYELVKIYHPDRHLRAPAAEHPIVASRLNPGAGVECLSRAVKLERYRLVVAANDILSDPAKRAAYDRYGAGWAERLELTGGSGRRGAKGHGWDPWDGRSAARNATWEDWERWREQGGVDGGRAKQEPVYVSNGAFVVLLLLVAMVGVAAEIRRADGLSRSFLEQVKAANDERSRELGRKRMGEGVEGTWSREERVGHFLRSREDAVSTYLDGDRKLVPRPAGRIEHEWEK